MSRIIEVDGSIGEGGGQVLRTSLALSALLGCPVHIRNIRAGREKPGLRPQHLAGARALARITGGRLEGDATGSKEICFFPGRPKPGSYVFDVAEERGSAGSVTLLAQTLLPLVGLTPGEWQITLKGGTHVPFSPPFDYLDSVFLPSVEAMGLSVEANLELAGYYPQGGGVVHLRVAGASSLSPLRLETRGALGRAELRSVISGLNDDIAHREIRSAREELAKAGYRTVHQAISRPESHGPGTLLLILTASAQSLAGFSSLGRRGKRAEALGKEAAAEAIAYLESGAAVDRHLADQLVLYMALAEGRSIITTEEVTSHLLTNIQVISVFLGIGFDLDGELGAPGAVAVTGVGYSAA